MFTRSALLASVVASAAAFAPASLPSFGRECPSSVITHLSWLSPSRQPVQDVLISHEFRGEDGGTLQA